MEATDFGFAVREHAIDFRQDAILPFLSSLPVGSDDAILFLFSGHGIIDRKDNLRWPQLYYCSEDDLRHGNVNPANCLLSLKDIHDRIRELNVRMSITLGSSCNNDPAGQTAVAEMQREGIEQQRSGGAGEAHQNIELFTEFEGHILASGSLPGQKAFLNDADGSYFVAAFCNVLSDGLLAEQTASWASIFRKTGQQVEHVNKLKNQPQRQTPQFLIFRDDHYMYSKPDDTRYSDDPDTLYTIDAAEFSADWELEFEREEAMELVPYLLVERLLELQPQLDDEAFVNLANETVEFYKNEVLLDHYYGYDPGSGFGEILMSLTLQDISDDYFSEELAYARQQYAALAEPLRQRIDNYLAKMGR